MPGPDVRAGMKAGAARLHAPVVLPCTTGCPVLRDAVVDIDDDGRIAFCGAEKDAPATNAQRVHLDGILVPGMINAHAHSPMTLLRGIGGDLPLLRWLREAIWPAEARLRPADVGAGMLLGAVEMVRSGITTSAETYLHGRAVTNAALQSGLRVVLGGPVMDIPGMDWRAMITEISNWIDDEGTRFGPGDRIELGYGAHAAYTLPREGLEQVTAAAAERGALVQIHVAESAGEDAELRERYGSVPLMLESIGLLKGRVLAAHAVHMSDEDVAVFARSGTGVAHCPGSNGKLASGIAPVAAMRAAGIPVGLGTDGPASNDGLDPWHEMRMAGTVARLASSDPTALTACDLLMMATAEGAAALGRDDIGVLSASRWADLVHVDLDTPAFPGGSAVPDGQLLANLVWASGAAGVRDVWVAGERVLAAGELTRIDPAAALAAARAATAHLL